MKTPFPVSVLFFWLIFLIGAPLVAQQKVKLHAGVRIGGINQLIHAEGKDDSKPVLLFLHGGPGFPSRGYSRKFARALKDDFIFVEWDQRESGATAHWSPFPDSLTLEMFHQDTEEVVDYLLGHFGREKIYLVGFSWGGFLGMHYANQHPDKLHAYVSVSSMVHMEESERLTLGYLQERARTSNNQQAITELNEIMLPISSWQELYAIRKWTAHYTNPDYSYGKDAEELFRSWSVRWLDIYQQAAKVNYIEQVKQLDCPVYFFVSPQDYVANHHLATTFYESLRNTDKHIRYFKKGNHELAGEAPREFAEALLEVQEDIIATQE